MFTEISNNSFPERGVAAELPTVVVAMSGGVDSSASALLLAEAGYSVVGISMQVWDYRKNQGNAKKATCCAPSDFDDARQVAQSRNIPFYVFDFEESFEDAVIKPFVQSYLDGYTPNPCLECNRKVKFRELRKRAFALGCSVVATGHYARIRKLEDGSWGLFTARDATKDQSYFLYAMTQQDLANTLFPVGDMVKEQVRAYLTRAGVQSAEKEESQDICFVSGETAAFVKRKALRPPAPGSVLNRVGEKLGEHDGIHQFTVGQRKGIGVTARNPLYVLEINPSTNAVVVGEREDLARESFHLREVHWISGRAPSGAVCAIVKVRYRHQGVPCEIVSQQNGTAEVRFLGEWSAVSPGQAAVFYAMTPCADGAVQVLGGGIIERA